MKKNISVIITIILCLIIYGCEKTKVTFNYNCPGISNYKCDVTNKKLDCTFTMPECKDKEFIGWYDAPINGHEINLDRDFEENMTLYAYWNDNGTTIDPIPNPVEETYYIIIFNANGGTGGQIETVQAKYENQFPEISKEKPIRENYTFMGWYDNSNYEIGRMFYNSECVSVGLYDRKEDIILYAGWKANEVIDNPNEEYRVSFNTNGGDGQYSDVYITYGSDMPAISSEIPIRSGYTFIGWYDNSDYTKGNKYYDSNCLPSRNFNRKENIILYAGWKANTYTITYNLNGGTGGQSGSLSVTPNSELPTISWAVPSRSGYTFTGWYDNSDYTKGTKYYNEKCEAVKTFDKNANLTLYAGWSKIVIVYTYKVTFNINNGVGNVPTQVNVELGKNMPTISSNVPSKNGYTFMGWYDNADYTKGTQYYNNKNQSSRSYDKMNDITLYAGWKANTLSIQYNGNGGTWISTNANFGVNSSGMVIVKSTGEVYSKKINYGTDTESSGLTDYNGSWFKWKRDSYYVESGKEYYLQNGSTKNLLDQTKVYSAIDLAKYAGCDLSKKDCTITVKVNWEEYIYADYGPCKIELKRVYVGHDKYEYGLCVPEKYNGEKLPLIIFLHGMTSDTESSFYYNFNTWANLGFNGALNNWPKYGLKNIPAIMMMPWSKGPDKWNNEWKYIHIDAAYNEVINNYNIDTDNVCLMGASIGGQGVFTVASRFPTRFKSIVAMSAYITKPAGDIEYFKNMPMKGYAEKYVPPGGYNYEKTMTELFKNIGHPNDLRVVPVKHIDVPEYALTIDDNGDGISDLIYWVINGGKDPK